MRALIFIVMTCVVLSSGCTSNVTRMSEKGLFQIKLSAKGQLLKDGRNAVVIYVTDAKGTGVEGAKIEITPWMPEHGHGTMWPPTVTEEGKGQYQAVIALIMIGHWELKVKIREGDLEDSIVFDFPNVTK